MQSEFARDLADQDRPVEEAAAERPGKPIRVRIQPTIFRVESRGQYRAWRDVHWTLECESPAEVFALRDAMRAFFQALPQLGPATVSQVLRDAVRRLQGAA